MGQGCRHFKEGDRVLVYHISGCGFCPNCRRGFPICYDAHRGQHFENDLLGAMRKARDVAERLFYGR